MPEIDTTFLTRLLPQVRASRLPWFFGAAAGFLIVSLIAIFWIGQNVIVVEKEIGRREKLLTKMHATIYTLNDAEAKQRGYLLTHTDSYLRQYQSVMASVDDGVTALTQAAVGEAEGTEFDEFKRLVEHKIVELNGTTRMGAEGHTAEALAVIQSGESERSAEDLNAAATRIAGSQEIHLAELRSMARSLAGFRTLGFLIVGILNLLFEYWCFHRIKREMRTCTDALTDTARQREMWAVTLSSIGDAVIVTDAAGKIAFINDTAATLTGWTADQAKDQPCAVVFNIISEITREPAASPVSKVLESGKVIGLANHTVLIRKDSTEVAIDDSGAPIRDANGAIRGVVLVFRDFSAHKAAEMELHKAKEEAEAANMAKDKFLAMLSHELRTPLTPVFAILTAWEIKGQVPPTMSDDLQTLRRSMELEARLIDDLLDITRIVKGKVRLELEITDVHELLNSVAEMCKSEILARKIHLRMTLDAAEHFILADTGRFQQVFWNLLRNATKFTPEGGRIHVSTSNVRTSNDQGQIRISVQDNGAGISREALERIFQPFEQGSEESIRRNGGLGLGLAISKALVEAQSGTISATSEGVGQGAMFALQFPTTQEVRVVDTNLSKESSPENGPLHILLVEDHADTAHAILRLLNSLGHQVSHAGSVVEAVDQVKREQFDLLLSDIGLPDGTGIDVLRQAKTVCDPAMFAVAMTGYGMEEDIARSMEAGFNEHLTKPINFQRLTVIINRVAGNMSPSSEQRKG